MKENFKKIREFLIELEYSINKEDREEELFVVSKEESGIVNMLIDCEEPILVFEQYLFEMKKENLSVYKELLIKNREIVHGAFVLDETGTKIIFRDTLQIENIDMNEFQGTLNSLELLLAEYSDKLIEFSKL
ncbi:MAG: YbjN domain-containing protein [Marinifilaceae bacterium]|jgi:hypothetical protein|nr:molecular chaperone Tir [Marinilabiliaceae bacterium JC040]MCT4600212.1 YbjN domain-containing protein [Marinifilaceae bacterium]